MAQTDEFTDYPSGPGAGYVGPQGMIRISRGALGLVQSTDGAAPIAITTAPIPCSFIEETLLIAQQLMPDRAFNRVVGTDFTPITEASLSAAGTPVVDPTQAGGWVKFSGTAGQLALNPVTPGAATYNPILGTFDSMASPWLIRGRAMLNFQAFTAATSVILASLDGSGVGGGGATHKIQLLSIGSTHLQQLYIRLQNATLGPIDVSAGPDGLLGGANSQVAVNQPFTYTLYFDRVNIKWAFNDQYNNPINLLNGAAMSGPNMDAMPNDATSVTLQNTDTTNGANIYIDALAIAFRAAQGNK